MAITFKEIHDGRRGRYAGTEDESSTRSWRITTDDKSDDDNDIATAGWASGDLPRPLIDTHPKNSNKLCKSLDINQESDKGALTWMAIAQYDTRPVSDEDQQTQDQPDPLLRDAVYSGGFERDQKAINDDLDGMAIVNSAGDPFLEPITVPFTRRRIRGRKNVDPNAIPSWFDDLKDKVNDSALTRGGRTYEARTLLFIPGNVSEPRVQNDIRYVTIDWELEVRLETWNEKRVDNGYNQLVYNLDTGENDLKVPIEIDGARPAEPQLLDGDGGLLSKEDIDAGEFHELEWETIEAADFSVLP